MSGIANSLIALFELQEGAGQGLRDALAALEGRASPFAGVTGTHFARWAHVPGLPGPDGRPLRDEPEYLLMCADFDPRLEDWVAAWCESGGADVDAVMSHCVGWPGSRSPAAVAEYLARHHSPAGFTVSTYGRVSVRRAREALELRRSLRRLAVRAQRLSAGELRREWGRLAGR